MSEETQAKQAHTNDADIVDGTSDIHEASQQEPLTMEEQLAALEEALATAKQETLLALADNQNLRRRQSDELIKERQYAVSRFAQELVTVKDFLEMALMDNSGNVDAMKMGVDLTLKQLTNAFSSVKITEIETKIGDKLDANIHQAMSTEIADAETDTIVRVLQKGYKIADRLLRPVSVVVAKSEATDTTA
jgi:molecular chaperone GrpE